MERGATGGKYHAQVVELPRGGMGLESHQIRVPLSMDERKYVDTLAGDQITAANIRSHVRAVTEAGPMGWGVDAPFVELHWDEYALVHTTGTGRLVWHVDASGDVDVFIRRPDGNAFSVSMYVDGDGESEIATNSRTCAFGFRHYCAARDALLAVFPAAKVDVAMEEIANYPPVAFELALREAVAEVGDFHEADVRRCISAAIGDDNVTLFNMPHSTTWEQNNAIRMARAVAEQIAADKEETNSDEWIVPLAAWEAARGELYGGRIFSPADDYDDDRYAEYDDSYSDDE